MSGGSRRDFCVSCVCRLCEFWGGLGVFGVVVAYGWDSALRLRGYVSALDGGGCGWRHPLAPAPETEATARAGCPAGGERSPTAEGPEFRCPCRCHPSWCSC